MIFPAQFVLVGLDGLQLVADSTQLASNASDKCVVKEPHNKLRVVKYHDLSEFDLLNGVQGQGVEPHKDGGLTMY